MGTAMSEMTTIEKGALGMDLAGGIMQTASALQSGFAAKNQNYFAARASKAQADLIKASAANENKYLNAAAASQDLVLADELKALNGTQKAIMAASGFDISAAGEEHIIMKTRSASDAERQRLLQNFTNTAFEKERGAKMAAIGLNSEANLYKIAGKSAVTTGFINAGAAALETGSSLLGSFARFAKNPTKKGDK